MDIKLKQRLVGALVIVGLLVIFVPVFLSDSKDKVATQDYDFKVPSEPVIKKKISIKPRSTHKKFISKQSSKKHRNVTKKTKTKATRKVALTLKPKSKTKMMTSTSNVKSISKTISKPSSVSQKTIKKSSTNVAQKPKKQQQADDYAKYDQPFVVTSPKRNQTTLLLPLAKRRYQPIKQVTVKTVDSKTETKIKTKLNTTTKTKTKKNVKSLTEPTVTVRKKTKPVVSKTTSKTANKKPLLAPQVTGWAVQLASFSQIENADRLVKKLQEQRFPAYIQIMKTSKGKRITRVLVGPELDRNDAQQLLTKLEKLTQLQGIVVTYTPV